MKLTTLLGHLKQAEADKPKAEKAGQAEPENKPERAATKAKAKPTD